MERSAIRETPGATFRRQTRDQVAYTRRCIFRCCAGYSQSHRRFDQQEENSKPLAGPSNASGTTTVGEVQVPIWNVPYQRNPLFTGREDVLKRLYDALRGSKAAALGQT